MLGIEAVSSEGGHSTDADTAAIDASHSLLLVDRDLVVRYHIDLEGNGSTSLELMDAADMPLPLAIVTDEPNILSFVNEAGHRGLDWPTASDRDVAGAPITSTKLQNRLDDSTTATMEIVVDFRDLSSNGTPLLYIGMDREDGRFSLIAYPNHVIRIYWQGYQIAGEWSFPLIPSNRIVLHAVLDTTRANAEERMRLYIDGRERMRRWIGSTLANGETLDIPDNGYFALGNVWDGETADRSGAGTIYYAAVYQAALDPDEVMHNVAVLHVSDDRP